LTDQDKCVQSWCKTKTIIGPRNEKPMTSSPSSTLKTLTP
jgi:hypothetical protein